MAFSNIAIKNTDEVYATHNDLTKILHTSLISDFWHGVEEYRNAHAKKILLKTMDNLPFYFVETPALLAKFNNFKTLLARYQETYETLLDMPKTKEVVDRRLSASLLRLGMKIMNLSVNDNNLKAILTGYFDSYPSDSSDARTLAGYRNALRNIDLGAHEYDSDMLGAHYGLLQAQQELTSFYRQVDNVKQTVSLYAGFSHVYKEAPASDIDTLMESMFTFEKVDACIDLYKATAVAFYFTYVKPFDKYNEVLAALAFKSIIGGHGASYIPSEAAFMLTPRYEEIAKETMLSGDLTYILVHLIDTLSPMMKEMIDVIAIERKKGVEEEASRIDDIPTPPPAPAPAPAPKIESAQEQEIPEYEFEEDWPAMGEAEPASAPAPIQVELTPVKEEPAMSIPRETINERDVKDWARFLLETHPMLKKTQCLFFATHCTMGRYYSIQDYKRFARCVYETARTSMDNLAREGLYRKLKIKNKYLYTPIMQKGE